MFRHTGPSIFTADGVEAAELVQWQRLVMVVLPSITFGSGCRIRDRSATEDLGCDGPLHDDYRYPETENKERNKTSDRKPNGPNE